MAQFPELVEHCLSFQSDDIQVKREFELGNELSGTTSDGKTKFIATTPERSPSAVRNWNSAARISSGELLLIITDDLVPDRFWDSQLWQITRKDSFGPRLWKITDSRCMSRGKEILGDILPRHPLMNRELYQDYGHVFDPRYVTVGPDDEWLLQGIKNNFIRDARMVQLHHGVGKILDSSGNLLCGCSTIVPNMEKTKSQIMIHGLEWKIVARKNLAEWGYLWHIVLSVSSSEKIANETMNILNLRAISKVSPIYIIFSLLCSKNLTGNVKLLLIRRFFTQFFQLTPRTSL